VLPSTTREMQVMKDAPTDARSVQPLPPGVDRAAVAVLIRRVLGELAAPGDWWDGASRRAIMAEARAARGCEICCGADGHRAGGELPAAAVEVIHRVVNGSGRLDRSWADAQIDQLGDAPYAEIVGVTATLAALDVTARALGEPAAALPDAVDGAPARERPVDVGNVGAWVPMTEEKVLANVSRALSLVPRTNATWRALVTEAYSRGREMLELTWNRALTRPQVELIASEVSRLQECFY
jgi:hypothetical protein